MMKLIVIIGICSVSILSAMESKTQYSLDQWVKENRERVHVYNQERRPLSDQEKNMCEHVRSGFHLMSYHENQSLDRVDSHIFHDQIVIWVHYRLLRTTYRERCYDFYVYKKDSFAFDKSTVWVPSKQVAESEVYKAYKAKESPAINIERLSFFHNRD